MSHWEQKGTKGINGNKGDKDQSVGTRETIMSQWEQGRQWRNKGDQKGTRVGVNGNMDDYWEGVRLSCLHIVENYIHSCLIRIQ